MFRFDPRPILGLGLLGEVAPVVADGLLEGCAVALRFITQSTLVSAVADWLTLTAVEV